MPTCEDDVLRLMNRAAMDPPSMSLAARSVLASAQGRRRKQRQTRGVMALAGLAAVAAVWVGAGPGVGELLGTQIDPADTSLDVEVPAPSEWDDTVSFEAALPSGGVEMDGFNGGTLTREPGEGFTVTFDDDETGTLEPIEADLPSGVEWFSRDGTTLVVSEPRYDGQPLMSFDGFAAGVRSTGVGLGDGKVQPFVWLSRDLFTPEDLNDIFWLLPDQVVASSGTPIINEVVQVDGDEVPLMIAPQANLWAQRSRSGLASAVEPGDINGIASDGDLYVSVFPIDAGPVTWAGPGGASVPTQTRRVGSVKLAWATSDVRPESDGLSPFAVQEPDAVVGEPVDLRVTDRDGEIDITVEGTDTTLTVDADGQAASGAIAGDGSALAVGALPEGITTIEGPLAADTATPDLVIRYADGPLSFLIRGQGISLDPSPGAVLLPTDTGMVAVGTPPQPDVDTSTVEVLPTLLFTGLAGPQWAEGGRPTTVEVRESEFRVAVEPDLGVWASSCVTSEVDVNDVGSVPTFLACPGPAQSQPWPVFGVMVLPSEVAQTARFIPSEGTAAEFRSLGEPIVAELEGGLAFWVMPLGQVDDASPTFELTVDSIDGLDLDGDGKVDARN